MYTQSDVRETGAGSLPDHERTPGAVNSYVTQDNIKATACVARLTHWVTPSSTYTNRLKAQQIREWGLQGAPDSYYEDQLVPVCVGGHPRDPRNLWPQPVKGKLTAAVKDQLEASVCRAVCGGKMTLEEGRRFFSISRIGRRHTRSSLIWSNPVDSHWCDPMHQKLDDML
jgi:hypothetical protein